MWKAACFVEGEGGNTMARETILYISDQAANSNSVLAALKATGYEVVSTNSAAQGVALLYIMRTVAAVVLDNRAREQAGFDVAQSLRAIRPGVPIVLLCRDRIEQLPSFAEACVSTRQPLENLTSAVRRLFAANRPGRPLADPAHSAA
jgi:DNA-binding NtrC family response regulator